MSRDIFEQWTKEGKKMDKCKWVDGEFLCCDGMREGKKEGLSMTKQVIIIYCPWCGEPLKKPVEIKVGMFGYFWDKDNNDNEYGILTTILNKDETEYIYKIGNGCSYNYFKPGLPEGFNQDGTPK